MHTKCQHQNTWTKYQHQNTWTKCQHWNTYNQHTPNWGQNTFVIDKNRLLLRCGILLMNHFLCFTYVKFVNQKFHSFLHWHGFQPDLQKIPTWDGKYSDLTCDLLPPDQLRLEQFTLFTDQVGTCVNQHFACISPLIKFLTQHRVCADLTCDLI